VILTGKVIKLPEINIESQATVYLLNKKDRRYKEGLTRFNETLTKVVCQISFDFF
jgi:hypothetical protein